MANNVTVYVPTATDVVVKVFTNSGFLERIVLDIEGMGQWAASGSGESNTLIGQTHFTTPTDGGDDGQITITVTIDCSQDGGQSWAPTDVFTDACTIQAFNLIVVVAEDQVDQDYNDAICMISWPGASSSGHEVSAPKA